MDDLFLVLALLSILGLFISLIKPSWLKLKSRKQSLIVFGGGIILFFILFGITSKPQDQSIVSSDTSYVSSNPAPVHDNREIESTAFAEHVIEGVLKSPSTAKFSDVAAYELSDKKDVWAVNGYVDSQNSFGAMIRSQWEVQLDYRDGKGGAVLSILLDGKKIQ